MVDVPVAGHAQRVPTAQAANMSPNQRNYHCSALAFSNNDLQTTASVADVLLQGQLMQLALDTHGLRGDEKHDDAVAPDIHRSL